MKFSLIHPSRSRPEKSRDTMLKWIRSMAVTDFELIVSVDKEDPMLGRYGIMYPSDVIEVNENKNAVEAINNAAKISKGDILIVVSDDSECPLHWDKILLDAIGQSKDFVMKTDDGIQKRIITMPIMDRIYYSRDGHIYDPAFSHSWCDTYLTEKAHKRGRVITRMDIKFPHLHYSVIGEQPDELYKRNDLTHDRDRHIYQRKLKELHALTN
jgi:hypothetical protein